MTDEFRAYLSVEIGSKDDKWNEDRLYEMLSAAVRVRGGSMGGTILPEPVNELEFYDNLVNDIANTITGMEISGQESDDIDKVYVWPQGAHNIAQYVIDMLTKEAII